MADLIVTNARALTQNPAQPTAEAVAVTEDRIQFVGSEADALALRGPDTVVLDAAGKTLLPGIIDSHFHLLWGSLRLDDIGLEGVQNLDRLRATILSYRDEHPNRPLLRGQGLSYDVLPDRRLHRTDLDAVVADVPLVLTCFDVHTVWCNTVALEAAGILRGASLSGGEVVLDPDGLATGELREFPAMDLVYALFPEPSAAERLRLLRRGVAQASSYGVTSVHNMNGDPDEFALYRTLDEAGELPLRLYVPYRITPEMPVSVVDDAVALQESYRSDKLKAGAFKLFMDGVVESYTAFLTEPYVGTDHVGTRNVGEALFSAEHFSELAVRADRAGLQVAVHAVGDAAVRRALDGFETAQKTNGKRDSRHRIEHIELLHPDDLERFAALGVVASMQPYHCTRPELGYLPSWLRYVPEGRFNDSFAWRTLRDAGAHLTFGSDWPVVSMNPFLGFDAAVNRQPWGPGLPRQAQSLDETLAAYTRDGAYTEFAEHDKGQLRAGMLADMVLLSEDVTTLPPEELVRLEATLTVCGGQVVFER